MRTASEEQFDELKELISVLRSDEREVAKKHLTAYSTNHTLKSSRALQLFKMIEKDPDLQKQRAYKKLKYNSIRSFNRMIQRTVARIEESLILEVNIGRPEAYSQLFTTKFKIRKLIMQSQILSARGLIGQSLKLTDAVLKAAKAFELYDEIIEALYNKQVLVGLRKGEQFYNRVKKEIQFYESSRVLLNKTKDRYRSFYAASDFSGIVKDKTALLHEVIEEVDKDQKSTQSINIKVLSFLLKMEYHFIKTEFLKVEKIGKELISIIKNNVSVYSSPRIGAVYFNLVDASLALYDFKQAKIYADKSENYLKNNQNFNLLTALEYKVLSEFYIGNYSKSLSDIENLLSINVINKFPFKKAKAIYFKAVTLFITGDYKHAGTLLYNINEIEKDKEGWNVWIRILRILSSVEMLRLSMIEYDVESFRKYMIRTAERSDVRERDRLVLKVLLELDRQEYDFKATAKIRKKTLEKLASLDPLIRWEPKSPELVLFHDWFEAKVEDREYSPSFDIYKNAAMKASKKQDESMQKQHDMQQLSLDLNVP